MPRPEDMGDPRSDLGAPNRTWEENERLRIQAISVDSGKKAPKYYGAPWVKDWNGGQG